MFVNRQVVRIGVDAKATIPMDVYKNIESCQNNGLSWTSMMESEVSYISSTQRKQKDVHQRSGKTISSQALAYLILFMLCIFVKIQPNIRFFGSNIAMQVTKKQSIDHHPWYYTHVSFRYKGT